eukprot:7090788-Prymnesium_polylepis.1
MDSERQGSTSPRTFSAGRVSHVEASALKLPRLGPLVVDLVVQPGQEPAERDAKGDEISDEVPQDARADFVVLRELSPVSARPVHKAAEREDAVDTVADLRAALKPKVEFCEPGDETHQIPCVERRDAQGKFE